MVELFIIVVGQSSFLCTKAPFMHCIRPVGCGGTVMLFGARYGLEGHKLGGVLVSSVRARDDPVPDRFCTSYSHD